jgi:hypothetical protein
MCTIEQKSKVVDDLIQMDDLYTSRAGRFRQGARMSTPRDSWEQHRLVLVYYKFRIKEQEGGIESGRPTTTKVVSGSERRAEVEELSPVHTTPLEQSERPKAPRPHPTTTEAGRIRDRRQEEEGWRACTITAARITTAPPTGRSTTTPTSPRFAPPIGPHLVYLCFAPLCS